LERASENTTANSSSSLDNSGSEQICLELGEFAFAQSKLAADAWESVSAKMAVNKIDFIEISPLAKCGSNLL
jgi:hypothetical protein